LSVRQRDVEQDARRSRGLRRAGIRTAAAEIAECIAAAREVEAEAGLHEPARSNGQLVISRSVVPPPRRRIVDFGIRAYIVWSLAEGNIAIDPPGLGAGAP